MKKHLLLALGLFVLPLSLFAQGAAFRAQGRYYSAKAAYEAGQYADAAKQCRESREFLGGKSNVRLQYLLVCALYNGHQFKAAQEEMNLFFKLSSTETESWEERKKLYQEFPQEVDKLTSDEFRAVSIMIDKIDREVSTNTEGKESARKELAAAFESLKSHLNSRYNGLTWELKGEPDRCTLVHTNATGPNLIPGRKVYKTTTVFSFLDVTSMEIKAEQKVSYMEVDALVLHFNSPVASGTTLYVADSNARLQNSGTQTSKSNTIWFGIDNEEEARPVMERFMKALRESRKNG